MMWIKRELFERLLTERANAQGVAQTLERRTIAQDTTIDWLKVRLTQIEYERAQLINTYMGVKIPVPEFSKSVAAEESLSIEKVLAATVDFSDIGDDAAKAQGLDWDGEGRLTRNGKLVQD
jgi:hypothetical protein